MGADGTATAAKRRRSKAAREVMSLAVVLLLSAQPGCGAEDAPADGAAGAIDGQQGVDAGQSACTPSVKARVRWRIEDVGAVSLGLASAADGAMFMAASGEARRLDHATGKTVWATKLSASSASVALAPGGERVFYAGDEVQALNPATGEELWRKDVTDGKLTGVVASADRVIAMAYDKKRMLVGLAADSGALKWGGLPGLSSTKGPFLAGNLVLTYLAGTLTALYVSDGTAAWTVKRSADWSAVVGQPDGTVYAISKQSLMALDADGKARWQSSAGAGTSVTVAAGLVCTRSYDSGPETTHVQCFATDGSPRWDAEFQGSVAAPIAAGTGLALVAGASGKRQILGLNLKGDVLWSHQPSSSEGPLSVLRPGPMETIIFATMDLSAGHMGWSATLLDPAPDAIDADKLACAPCSIECGPSATVRQCKPDGAGHTTVETCGASAICSAGACKTCTPKAETKCAGGHPTYYDSCGNKGERKETCATGTTCSSATKTCKKKTTSCKLTCKASSSGASHSLSCGTSSRKCTKSYKSGKVKTLSCTYTNGKSFKCTYNWFGSKPSGYCTGSSGAKCSF